MSNPNTLAMRRSRGGYSLVELMITVAVIGIAAALVVPMFFATDITRLNWAARLLVSDLEYSQMESIAHGDDPRVIVFDTVNDAYSIAPASDTATPITEPISKQPYTVVFGQGRARELAGVTIDNVVVGGDDQLGFGIYGQLDQTTAATIRLAAEGRTITITIDPIGLTTIGPVN